MNLTRNKNLFRQRQAESLRGQNLRVEYWELIRDVRPEDLIFLDESRVNLAMVRTYARALEGERAYGERPYHQRENITLIGAIALTGWIGAMTIDGGTNGNICRVFVEHILVTNLWAGACVVMDNLPAHKVDGIRQLIQDKGAHLIYLSPYSPDFNRIENCWSKIKEFWRSLAARSRENLENGITSAMDAITLHELQNWFAHCCYCTSLS